MTTADLATVDKNEWAPARAIANIAASYGLNFGKRADIVVVSDREEYSQRPQLPSGDVLRGSRQGTNCGGEFLVFGLLAMRLW